MKAFLLAGGHGTRLRPLTDSVPKCLVPIRGRPLLDIWLDLCARAGISDVLINLHAHPQPIEQHLARSGSPVNVRLVHEDRLLGSAGTMAANRAWIGSDPAFWILYSDVLTNTNLRRMSEFHSRHGGIATLGLYQVPDPSRCGVAITDEQGVIIDFEEKPETPRSNWVFSGLMVAGPRLFELIPPPFRRISVFMFCRVCSAKCEPIPSQTTCSTSGLCPTTRRRRSRGPAQAGTRQIGP